VHIILDAEKLVAKNGTSYISVAVASNYSFAAAYCAKKEMTLASLETEAELNLISSVAKGKMQISLNTSKLNLFLELSVSEIWTSGIIERTLTPCAGDLTINWCSSNQTQISTWWQGKVSGMDQSAISKAVSLKDSSLKVSSVDAALPFFCKVR